MPPPYRTDAKSLERDTDVEFYTASGPGGQHRNKTESGVRLHHRPSGLRIAATERRSQHANLEVGFARLAQRLAELNYVPPPRVPTKVSRGQKRRRVDDKVRAGGKKSSRARVRSDD